MSYQLILRTDDGSFEALDLYPMQPQSQQEEIEVLSDDYGPALAEHFVYNDKKYSLSVANTSSHDKIRCVCFNDGEEIKDYEELSEIFKECFGLVRLKVIINNAVYVTLNISVMVNRNNYNNGILDMINCIYANYDEFLYEKRQFSTVDPGKKSDKRISLNTKLVLLNEICEACIKNYQVFKNSAQSKIVSRDTVGNFSKLHTITAKTINYISTHPDELTPVNYNSGISVNKRYYQPERTMISTVSYSYDIFENKIVVGFLAAIILELRSIRKDIFERKKRYPVTKPQGIYVESSYYIYEKNVKILDEYLDEVNKKIILFQQLFNEYKELFSVEELIPASLPRCTIIFMKIMPYRIIFGYLKKWFECGNCYLSYSDLFLSFVKASKVYEYYCLIRLNQALLRLGCSKDSFYRLHYSSSVYYINMTHNNTFRYRKDNALITLFFQPMIYGEFNGNRNGIELYRSSSSSISKIDSNELDDMGPQFSKFYTPDYLLKIEEDGKTRYMILDAKYSTAETIRKNQLMQLVFKYIFSVQPLSENASAGNMCIMCGKNKAGSSKTNIQDISDRLSFAPTLNAHIITLYEGNTYDPRGLENLISGYKG